MARTRRGSGFKVIHISNSHDFKTPLSAVTADSEPERRFIKSLLETQNLSHYDAWIKSTSKRFYEIEYIWEKGNIPKRGNFNPDFFLKVGNIISIVEIKDDNEIKDPPDENRRKFALATAHF